MAHHSYRVRSVVTLDAMRTADFVGGLAQLVERLLCKQDVNGSSPLTSTERCDGSTQTETRQQLIYKPKFHRLVLE